MGKRDIPIVVYFQDDERYADLLDVHIFGGRRVVTAEDIREKDSRVNGVLGKVKSRFQFQKYRDAVRRVQEGRREGQAEGAMSKAQTVAHNMFNRSMSAEDTAAICEESLEQVQMWFAEWGK